MPVLQGSVRAAPSHDLMHQSDSPSPSQPLFLSYLQTLIPRDTHLPPFFFSSASPLPTFSLCSITSASLQQPTELYQVTESQAVSSDIRFDSTEKWNLNTECPLFLLRGFHLKPWPWRLERTKNLGSLGWLHAISYSFSNPHQTSFIHAFSYKSEARPAESHFITFPFKNMPEKKTRSGKLMSFSGVPGKERLEEEG